MKTFEEFLPEATKKEIEKLNKILPTPKVSDVVALTPAQINLMKKLAKQVAGKMSPEELAAFKAAGLL